MFWGYGLCCWDMVCVVGTWYVWLGHGLCCWDMVCVVGTWSVWLRCGDEAHSVSPVNHLVLRVEWCKHHYLCGLLSCIALAELLVCSLCGLGVVVLFKPSYLNIVKGHCNRH